MGTRLVTRAPPIRGFLHLEFGGEAGLAGGVIQRIPLVGAEGPVRHDYYAFYPAQNANPSPASSRTSSPTYLPADPGFRSPIAEGSGCRAGTVRACPSASMLLIMSKESLEERISPHDLEPFGFR